MQFVQNPIFRCYIWNTIFLKIFPVATSCAFDSLISDFRKFFSILIQKKTIVHKNINAKVLEFFFCSCEVSLNNSWIHVIGWLFLSSVLHAGLQHDGNDFQINHFEETLSEYMFLCFYFTHNTYRTPNSDILNFSPGSCAVIYHFWVGLR